MGKVKIRVKKPWICYPGSAIQQNYSEELSHGYLHWTIEDKNKFDVKFKELPNLKPFVTVEWKGSVNDTIEFCKKNHKKESRFRIYSKEKLLHKDIVLLTNELKSKLSATEVTYKTDSISVSNIISAYNTKFVKNDLRSSDILYKLFLEFYEGVNLSEEELSTINSVIKNYSSNLKDDEIKRNSKWSLKHIKFDNVLAYGEGNSIDFEKLSGIVGIFGPNRIGKSSVVGTIMYSLFNSTDRGSMKNIHVVNMRKPHCYSRVILNSDGTDYVIERQTVKSQNKKGQMSASTSLNIFKILNEEAIDLVGEQRVDTEKVIKSIIGTQEDFLLTSLSAQDEIKLFISQGSSKRRQILTKFLDLDIFDKLHDLTKVDLNNAKVLLKSIPEKNWEDILDTITKKLELIESSTIENNELINSIQYQIDTKKSELHKHDQYVVVTPTQLSTQEARVNALIKKHKDIEQFLFSQKEKMIDYEEKISSLKSSISSYNIEELSSNLELINDLKNKLADQVHLKEKNNIVLSQNQKSLKILDGIPCGTQYPDCKFIKDAYSSVTAIDKLKDTIKNIEEKISKFETRLSDLKHKEITENITKYEKMSKLLANYELEYSRCHNDILKFENELTNLALVLENEKRVYNNIKSSLEKDENLEVIKIKSEIEELQEKLANCHKKNIINASDKGRCELLYQNTIEERKQRDNLLNQTKIYDLILNAFCKKGIPSKIIAEQLPILNSEISNILHGIVDFNIELEFDEESDSMEVYINYGDSKRLIELCSGMEKMIASIAIRVALINISTLPKTDMFIIDEGFGALDEQGVESCNRLLMLLKKYFKTVIVITHVEGIKDAADTIIEVMKNEKDAKINYE